MDNSEQAKNSAEGKDTVDGPPVPRNEVTVQHSETHPDESEKDTPGPNEVDGRPRKRQFILPGKESDQNSPHSPTIQSSLDGIYPPYSAEDEECYPVSAKPHRGYLLIINNVDFKQSSGMHMHRRSGSDRDSEQMKSMFEEMGFLVNPKRNLTVNEMRSVFLEAAKTDFSNLSTFACCILSHGKEGVVYGTDQTIDIREISSYFSIDSLAGKPKLFFIQACQGNRYMDSLTQNADTNPSDVLMDQVDGPSSREVTLPLEADFLYAYSTVSGYYAWRDSISGSWFIQTICQVFRQNAHKMELVRMLTKVNQKVSNKRSNVPSDVYAHLKRQIPSIVSQLRMEYFFKCPPLNPYQSYH